MKMNKKFHKLFFSIFAAVVGVALVFGPALLRLALNPGISFWGQ